jgi:hypothetical protein
LFVLLLTFCISLYDSVQPAVAQFGIAGDKRRAGTSFQELQEMAKKNANRDGEQPDLSNLGDLLNNKDALDNLAALGDQFGDAIKQMMNMSPEELAEQMQQAMKLMTDSDMIENVINSRDDVLKELEKTGAVPPEELEKYRNDPNYFEQKMREGFEQMGQMFSNPETLKTAAEAMKNMKGLMENPEMAEDLMKDLNSKLNDDAEIEQVRLQLLEGNFESIPGFQDVFDMPEMQEILKDPKKWKETVKEGLGELLGSTTRDEL